MPSMPPVKPAAGRSCAWAEGRKSRQAARAAQAGSTNQTLAAQISSPRGLVFDSELSIHCIHSMYSGINISQTDARPMYLQIMEQIRQRIAAGDWAAGQGIAVDPGTCSRLARQRDHRQTRLPRPRKRGRHRHPPRQRLLRGRRQRPGRRAAGRQARRTPGSRRRHRPRLGLTDDELAARLRRIQRDLDKK